MTYSGTAWADRLNYLAAIEDGWYWYGDGEAVSPEALDKADEILKELSDAGCPVPAMFPSLEEGFGMVMEWTNRELKQHLTLEITNDLKFEAYYINIEAKTAKYDTDVTTGSSAEVIDFIVKSMKHLAFSKK